MNCILDAVHRGQIAGDGHYTSLCSRSLERMLRAPDVLLTSSCTHALELAALLLDIKPGDEVILPSFTFPSTANAFVLRGGIPRFVDIRPDTLNMDETLIEKAITRKTRMIIPVHYAGVPCQMDQIMRISKKHRVPVVEDAAQALGSKFRGKAAGTFGSLNTLSFHETKNCISGEGGALVVMDEKYHRRAQIIRQKGTNRFDFLKGKVSSYQWVDVGSSFVPSELQAAFLFNQLKKIRWVISKRRKIYKRYYQRLAPLQKTGRIQLPFIPAQCVSGFHLFHVILESRKDRDRILEKMKQSGVSTVRHFYPLHLSPMGRQFGYRPGQLPITEKISDRLIRLPFYHAMTTKEQDFVIQKLKALL